MATRPGERWFDGYKARRLEPYQAGRNLGDHQPAQASAARDPVREHYEATHWPQREHVRAEAVRAEDEREAEAGRVIDNDTLRRALYDAAEYRRDNAEPEDVALADRYAAALAELGGIPESSAGPQQQGRTLEREAEAGA